MDLLHLNDRPGVYPDSYYAATANRHLTTEPFEGPAKADVCIIGGGFTGLSAALNLAEAGYDVVLLEAQRIAFGASGRNGGQIGSGQRQGQLQLKAELGADTARRLWDLGEEAKATVRGRIAKHQIDCDLKAGQLHADIKPRYRDDRLRETTLLREEYGYEQIEFLEREQMGAHIGSDAYACGAIDMGAGHLHPLNYALGLADAALAAGARLHERVQVRRVVSQSERHRVETDAGPLDAAHLIIACNGYLGELGEFLPVVANHVMPINNFIAVTEPLGEAKARDLIPNDVCVADSKFVVNYYRMTADKRLLFGGGETYSYKFPKDIASVVRPSMAEIYPDLGDVKIDYSWGGTLGITMTRMPHFVQLAPTVFSASGFSGHGVPTASIAGKIVADKLRGQAEQFDLYAGLKSQRFPGGPKMRHPLLVLAMTWYALRDRL